MYEFLTIIEDNIAAFRHVLYLQITLFFVIAIRLFIFHVAQPPFGAVERLPRRLLRGIRIHGVLVAVLTTVRFACQIHKEIGVFRQDSRRDCGDPVRSALRRPYLPAHGARVGDGRFTGG